MANYTISTYTAQENIGDSMANTNIETPITLTITPNPEYAIKASAFSITGASLSEGSWTGGDLPSTVASVAFTDSITSVGYNADNVVTATVTLASDFVVGNDDINISLPIDGDAVLFEFTNYTMPIDFDLLASLTGINYTFNNTNSGLTVTTGTGSGSGSTVVDGTANTGDTNIAGEIEVTQEQLEAGEDIVIGTVTVDVVETDLSSNEVDNPDNANDGIIEEVVVEEEQDDNFPGGQGPITFEPNITATLFDSTDREPEQITYDIIVDAELLEDISSGGNRSVAPVQSGGRAANPTMTLAGRAFTRAVVPSTKNIDSVDIGESIINPSGETKTIRIHGDAGASFVITAYLDDGDGRTIGSDTQIATSGTVTITSDSTFDNSKGFHDFVVEFPAVTATAQYGLNLTLAGTTTASSNVNHDDGGSNYYDYIFNQYVNPTLTVSVTKGNAAYTLTNNADVVVRGVAGKSSSSISYLKNSVESYDFNYTIAGQNLVKGRDLAFVEPIQNSSFTNDLSSWTLDTPSGATAFFWSNGSAKKNVTGSGETPSIKQDVLTVDKSYSIRVKIGGSTGTSGKQGIKVYAGTAYSSDLFGSQEHVVNLTAAGNGELKITADEQFSGYIEYVEISDWKNSNADTNDGTRVFVSNVTTTVASDGNSANVSGTFQIQDWGTSSRTIELDLSNAITGDAPSGGQP